LPYRTKSIPFQGYFVLTNEVVVQNVQFGVTDAKQFSSSSAEIVSVLNENGLDELTASAVGGDNLHLEYAVKSKVDSERIKKPHQSFVRIVNTNSGLGVNFVSKKAGNSQSEDTKHLYQVSVSLTDQTAAFGYASGLYNIFVLVGDTSYSKPVEWFVGSIDLVFPTKVVANLPLYTKSLLHTSDNTLEALPEIVHQMRPPAKRASNLVAGIFTILTIIPLVVFVAFVISLQPNVSRLSTFSSIAFVVCIVATLLLYVTYWLGLKGVSFYQTIKYICFLFPISFLIGSYSLAAVTVVASKQAVKK
jgi:hypothetical protein